MQPTFIGQKPCQPLVDYPKARNKNYRRFNSEWYKKYDWIEYSISTNLVYCFSCRHFVSNPNKKSKYEPAYTTQGIQITSDAVRKFDNHEASSRHQQSYGMWQSRVHSSESIAQRISSHHKAMVLLNQQNLKTIIGVVLYLAKQGVAFRGHDEGEESNNKGNFLELLSLISKYNEALKKHLKNKEVNYTSPVSQNQILSLLAGQVKNRIIGSIDSFFSILVDETTDISKKEIVSVCLRHVDIELNVHEDFIGFYSTASTTGERLYELIKTVLLSCKLDLNNMVGQAFDGASNMSGSKSGVAARFLKDYKKAIFVHCHSHKLNLAIQASCKHLADVTKVLDTVQSVSVFVERSAKRHALFEHVQGSQHITLKLLTETRWSSRFHSLEALSESFIPLVTFLEVSKFYGILKIIIIQFWL